MPRVLRPPPFKTHPNGATGIDHVVILSSSLDRTAAAFLRAGVELKRIRESERGRMGFRRLGPAVLEIVQRDELESDEASFWGLAVVVISLDDMAERLGERSARSSRQLKPGEADRDAARGHRDHSAVGVHEPGAAVMRQVRRWFSSYSDVLAIRDVRLLFSGLLVSATGGWAYNAALLAFVYSRTQSLTWVGAGGLRALPAVAPVEPVQRCRRRALGSLPAAVLHEQPLLPLAMPAGRCRRSPTGRLR